MEQSSAGNPLVDAADDPSCRPDFATHVYSGHVWMYVNPAGCTKRADDTG
jgi:hypothetical protein